MTLDEQIYAQAVVLARVDEAAQGPLLQVFCHSALVGLSARLRDGLTQEDCRADLVASAALYALAALAESDELGGLEEMRVGDITLKKSGNAATQCLRSQAALMMGPYLKDPFSFRSV